MNNYFKVFIVTLFLFFGVSCKSRVVFRESDIEGYLKEAKECFSAEKSKMAGDSYLPFYLQKYVDYLEVSDYVEHVLLGSGELLIYFKKIQAGDPLRISLEVDLNMKKDCGRVSVHEIQ